MATQIEQFLANVASGAVVVDASAKPAIQVTDPDKLVDSLETNGETGKTEEQVITSRKQAANRVQNQLRVMLLVASAANHDATKNDLFGMIDDLVKRAKLSEKGSAKREATLRALIEAIPGDNDKPIGETQTALAKSKKADEREQAGKIKQLLIAFTMESGITQNSIVNYLDAKFADSGSPFVGDLAPIFPEVEKTTGKSNPITSSILGKLNI